MTVSTDPDYRQIDVDHLLHPLTSHHEHVLQGGIVFSEADGITLKDTSGRTYLDCMAGMWCVNVGHGRREIAAATAAQMARLPYATSWWGYSNTASLECSALLAQLTAPLGLTRFHFTAGGSETNDAAFKVARAYWRLRGNKDKHKIISRFFGYHGTSYGALSATGIESFWSHFGPMVPGFLHIAPPYCYRCAFGRQYPGCDLDCAAALEAAILREGPDTVAAFVGEPVIGAGGVIVPPPEYWPRVREICDKYDVLLHADEVICGFGRTGTMFGMQQWGIRPDVMSLAKGITSGYLPLGALALNEAVFQGLSQPETPFMHGYTYNGHPVTAAAAVANMKIIVAEDLPARAARVGAHLQSRLAECRDFRHVGETRGIGMLAAAELVADKASKRPIDPCKKVGLRLQNSALECGLLVRCSREILTFAPPLIASEQDIDRMIDAIKPLLADLQVD